MKGLYRIASDVGGTFTDTVLYNPQTHAILISKVATTPQNQSKGTIEGMSMILSDSCLDVSRIGYVGHGMTVGTNAVLQRKGAKMALITNRHFRDVLEIGRQNRPSLYDFKVVKEPPLVDRRDRFGIKGRIDWRGQILEEIDDEEVVEVAKVIASRSIESVAVCLLHSYINPLHERRVRDILRSVIESTPICISCEILPEFREYERMVTTILNAYLMPNMDRYLSSLERELTGESGLIRSEETPLMIMESSGGVMSSGLAREKPVYTVLSGPAAGVVAGAFIGRQTGFSDLITMDMGGTSTDISLIPRCTPVLTSEGSLGGLPIKVPMIDIHAIGAGGGSVAWIDDGGGLRVGPRSAEAVPGPACYDQGGEEPTITDANVVLGRLNPDFFLGGKMRIDPSLSVKAIENRLARPLGMQLLKAAMGVVEVGNASMIRGIRVVSVERGYDPRDFVLVAYGGAGSLHAAAVASDLTIPKVIVPPYPGLLSALGMLISDIRHDFVITRISSLERVDYDEIEGYFRELEGLAKKALKKEGVKDEEVTLRRLIDVRYEGQSFELRIPVDDGQSWNQKQLRVLEEAFHKEHQRQYGHHDPQSALELVNYRVIGIAKTEDVLLKELPFGGINPASEAQRSSRDVFFQECQGFLKTPVFYRPALRAGNRIKGPAIIEEDNATTLLHPDNLAEIDRYGNVVIGINL